MIRGLRRLDLNEEIMILTNVMLRHVNVIAKVIKFLLLEHLQVPEHTFYSCCSKCFH